MRYDYAPKISNSTMYINYSPLAQIKCSWKWKKNAIFHGKDSKVTLLIIIINVAHEENLIFTNVKLFNANLHFPK